MIKKSNTFDSVSILQIHIDKAQNILSIAKTMLLHMENIQNPVQIIENRTGYEHYHIWDQVNENASTSLQVFKLWNKIQLPPKVRTRLNQLQRLYEELIDTVKNIMSILLSTQQIKFN